MNYQYNIEDDLCEAGSSPKQLFAMGEVRFPKCRFLPNFIWFKHIADGIYIKMVSLYLVILAWNPKQIHRKWMCETPSLPDSFSNKQSQLDRQYQTTYLHQ